MTAGSEADYNDPISVMERVLVAGSESDCPFGSSLNADFIHIDVDVSASQSPSDLSCSDKDFKQIRKGIEQEMRSIGLSGKVKAESGPVLFDTAMCPDPSNVFLDRRRSLRGGELGKEDEEARSLRGLQYGWPYNTGSGGGCYSCAKENCDDDTSGSQQEDCRRSRRELFPATITEEDEQQFWPVQEAIQDALTIQITPKNLNSRVGCFKNLSENDVTVDVRVKLVTVGEFCS
eukprot:CAMPEP_0194047488 /NCGR_PEP_ID=MMETSP0009_2-20130614/24997_1 /TAXON_ID=210454 /ORGANISM="Grammatophora oceanica, Strain CCMP 410" /LENGTH=232 /DNA_ID=CAMNT_0038693135 /DNA_START=114 /DNA_END=812 /DNA_ORIENTATION=+